MTSQRWLKDLVLQEGRFAELTVYLLEAMISWHTVCSGAPLRYFLAYSAPNPRFILLMLEPLASHCQFGRRRRSRVEPLNSYPAAVPFDELSTHVLRKKIRGIVFASDFGNCQLLTSDFPLKPEVLHSDVAQLANARPVHDANGCGCIAAHFAIDFLTKSAKEAYQAQGVGCTFYHGISFGLAGRQGYDSLCG